MIYLKFLGVAENMSHTPVKQYNRDILLQLRLHPLSLQKPETLPEIEFVKEKVASLNMCGILKSFFFLSTLINQFAQGHLYKRIGIGKC